MLRARMLQREREAINTRSDRNLSAAIRRGRPLAGIEAPAARQEGLVSMVVSPYRAGGIEPDAWLLARTSYERRFGLIIRRFPNGLFAAGE
jgi:hypothetical protein